MTNKYCIVTLNKNTETYFNSKVLYIVDNKEDAKEIATELNKIAGEIIFGFIEVPRYTRKEIIKAIEKLKSLKTLNFLDEVWKKKKARLKKEKKEG